MAELNRVGLPVIGFVGDDLIYLHEDNEENFMKKVIVGEDSEKIVMLGSVARFRPYEEVTVLDKKLWQKRNA